MLKVLSLLVLLSVAISGQRDAKWNWSSNNRNDINEPRDQPINRRKFERLEDFRGDRYDGREQDTRKLSSQNDDFYNNNNNNGYGLNRVNGQNPTIGNGYNSNGFGALGPPALGAPNNNIPFGNGNQFENYNPGFPQNNYRPGGFNGYNPGFQPNYNTPTPGLYPAYYPNQNPYQPNRFPYNPYQNNAANGVLVGPGGPTGLYGRPPSYPPNYNGAPFMNQQPFYGNNFNPGFNSGFNQIIPFNSKSGSGILADESTDESKKQANKKSVA